MKTIIAALDFSDATDLVVETAGKIAKGFGANVKLVHVVDSDPPYNAYGFTPGDFPDIHLLLQEARIRAGKALEEHREKLSGICESEAQIIEGKTIHALLELAKTDSADLVVVGAHGHGRIEGILLGSVADGLVRRAEIPVLVVPGAQRE